MTLRDWFAGQALGGGLEQGVRDDWDTFYHPSSEIAERAYEIADAMLAQQEAVPASPEPDTVAEEHPLDTVPCPYCGHDPAVAEGEAHEWELWSRLLSGTPGTEARDG